MGSASSHCAILHIQENLLSIICKICDKSLRSLITASSTELPRHTALSNSVISIINCSRLILRPGRAKLEMFSIFSTHSSHKLILVRFNIYMMFLSVVWSKRQCYVVCFSDSIIGNMRKQYVDTRTQANLSKLNANRKQELDIVTNHISEILEGRRNSGAWLS